MSSFKFLNLSGNPGKSCNVISFRDTQVMIDCTLDLMSTLAYLPLSITHNKQLSSLPNWIAPGDRIKSSSFTYKQARIINYEVKECQSGVHCVDAEPEFALFNTDLVDVAHIDVVLISNYLNMFGLPYLTERLGFSGVVYVTEPTYHFGRIMMEEMIRLIERTPKPKRQHLWKRVHEMVNLCLPPNQNMIRDPKKWLPIFSRDELTACLAKLKVVNFSQSIDIFGLFEVSAHSSGFCIGSCNWVLKSIHEKIVYLSQTSTLTTHPKPFESAPLQDAHIMILTNLTNSPLANPDAALGEFFTHTIQTLKNEGNVLIPCYPCGMVYDLIECIAGQLTAANLTQVPIYFISPLAEESLAYANILGEWLTSSKSNKVFVPEEPFIHSSLQRAGRLSHFTSVSDPAFNEAYKTPCVIFTSHPSLRFGDVVHFIQMWGQSSKNLLIMTEPDFPCTEALSPFLPLAMKIHYIPIDTNWNFKIVNSKLSCELRPAHLILHNSYATKPPGDHYLTHGYSTTDLMIELQNAIEDVPEQSSALVQARPKTTTMHAYNYQESFDLTGSRANFERMNIDHMFADQIIQSEIRPGLCFATVNGILVARDNKYTLKQIDYKQLDPSKGVRLPRSQYFYGNVNREMLMKLLAGNGFHSIRLLTNDMIEFKSANGDVHMIHVEDSWTHILGYFSDRTTRLRLQAIVASCLRHF